MKRPTATIAVKSPAGDSYSGRVVPFFDDEFQIQLRKNGRICLLPSTRECAFSSFETALDELVREIKVKLSYEKEDP